INRMFDGVREMEESVTYQAILRRGRTAGLTEGRAEGRTEGRTEGRLDEAREILFDMGRHKFGEAPNEIASMINAIQDHTKLKAMSVRVLDVNSWNELFSDSKAK